MKKLLLLICISMLGTACSVVGPGDRAVRLNFGEAQTDILQPGAYFYFPVARTLSKMSVRVQKDEFKTNSASRDMQDVNTIIAINWSVDPDKVYEVYTNIGTLEAVGVKVLRPAVNEVLKAATAKLTAEEILTRRIELKTDIDNSLKERMAKYGLLVSDISIVDLDFSAQFTEAIENKQIAEQRAKQASYEAQKATEDAKAAIERAKGQAASQRLVQKTITSQILQQQAIEKWDGKFPTVMGGSGTLPFVNLKVGN